MKRETRINRITSYDDLPEVLNMALVGRTLGCSLSKAYHLLDREDFPRRVVGQRVYVNKQQFLLWIDKMVSDRAIDLVRTMDEN